MAQTIPRQSRRYIHLAGYVETPSGTAPTLPKHVLQVVGVGSKKEMLNLMARRVVTAMANIHACWNRAVHEFPLHAMNKVGLAEIADASIAVRIAGTNPNEASRRFSTATDGDPFKRRRSGKSGGYAVGPHAPVMGCAPSKGFGFLRATVDGAGPADLLLNGRRADSACNNQALVVRIAESAPQLARVTATFNRAWGNLVSHLKIVLSGVKRRAVCAAPPLLVRPKAARLAPGSLIYEASSRRSTRYYRPANLASILPDSGG